MPRRYPPRVKPPPGQVQWDFAHRLGAGMVMATDFQPVKADPFPVTAPINLADRKVLTASGIGVLKIGGPLGYSWQADTTTDFWKIGNQADVGTTAVTVALITRKTDGVNRAMFAFGATANPGNQSCQALLPWSDGTVYWDFGGTTGSNRLTAAGLSFPSTAGDYEYWVFTAGTKGSQIIRDGKLIASQTTAITRNASANGDFKINAQGTANAGDLRDYAFFALYDYEWTQAQAAEWYADPFAMLQSARRSFVVNVPAAPEGRTTRNRGAHFQGMYHGTRYHQALRI